MDFRGNKVFDFVSATKNLEEGVKKSELIRRKWFREYQWLCDEYKYVQDELRKLCREKGTIITSSKQVEKDTRSCLPIYKTTNAMYGWLSSKPEFVLEKYGSYIINYPNPMDKIVSLSGNIPKIAAGKGYL